MLSVTEVGPTVRLRKNFAWTLIGTAIFALCQWAVLIAVTKLGSTRVAGDWTLALAVTAPIFIFMQFKLRTVQVADVRHEFRWGEYLALRLLGSLGAMVMVGAVVLIAYRDAVAPLILMIASSRVFDGISDLVYGQEQQRERMDRIAWSQIARGLSSLGAGVTVLWWTESAAWTAGATALTYGAWLLWDWARLRAMLGGEPAGPVWSPNGMVRLFRRVLPLGFVTAIGSLQVNIPRYSLDSHASREELGVFGALSYLLVFGNMVIFAVHAAALPRLSRQAADRDWRAFRRLIHRMQATGFALGACAVAMSLTIGAPVLRVFYSAEVARHADVLVWLCIGSWVQWTYVFLGTGLDAMRRFHVQPWIHGVSVSAIAVACAMLVPGEGMRGAAWGMLCGYCVEAVLYALVVAIPLHRMEREVDVAS